MNLSAAILMTLLCPAQSQISPETQVPAIDIQHTGDRRSYLAYPGKTMRFRVKAPLTVEIAVRAGLPGGRQRVRLRIKLKAGRQVLLDQSQVLGRDRRAKGAKMTRPLVAIADIPDGATRLRLEVSTPDSTNTTLAVAMSQVKVELADATRSELGDDLMVPDLVAMDTPKKESLASSASASSTPATAKTNSPLAAASVDDSQKHIVTRMVGIELLLLQGIELPSLDIAARYYLPFIEERLSLGIRTGYGFVRRSSNVEALHNSMNVSLDFHLIPILAMIEADVLRLDAAGKTLSIGLRADVGFLPFVGELREQTLLSTGTLSTSAASFSGLAWLAGGVIVAGYSVGPGRVTGEIGYHYSPALESKTDAASNSTKQRSIRAQVLGPRVGLGYRLDI